MKNFVQDGRYMTLPAPYARDSGEGALIGGLFGVAVTNIANGVLGVFDTEGVYTLKKKTGTDTGGAVGAAAYWVAADKEVTAVATNNTKIGNFAKACVDGDTVASVRISN
jgi:predicted RecA/RadA family phage recombinase